MKLWRIWRRKLKCLSLLLFISILLTSVVFFEFYSILDDEKKIVSSKFRKPKGQEEYIDKRGIHVIVGHYIGNDLPWNPSPNLTDEILNTNGYSPLPKAGEMGEAYFVLPAEREKSKALFYINKFNLLASDRIPVNRTLPDPRRKACRSRQYDIRQLPSTSIIIVYHNEAWSTLMRTIHSIINRSPHQLIKEIILVDDASTRVFLKKTLDEYVSHLEVPVKIIRSTNRTGLIRARLLGADIASGDVLTFLDAHCECSQGWLEPLLASIAQERKWENQ